MEMKLGSLRSILLKKRIDAFIIPTKDEHNSEYLSDHDMRRNFITGFNGSAGTAVVTNDKAALWVDGRYWVAAENEANPAFWKVIKLGKKGESDLYDWLGKNLAKGAAIGLDPYLTSVDEYNRYVKKLAVHSLEICLLDENPIDKIWNKQPQRSDLEISAHPIEYCGEKSDDKLSKVRSKLEESGCFAMIITTLDEIAWLLNLRGSDIACNPVFFAYCIVTLEKVELFVDEKKLGDSVKSYLNSVDKGVEVYGYKKVCERLSDLRARLESGDPVYSKKNVMVCTSECNYALYKILNEKQVVAEKISPVSLLKATKNECEIRGMKDAHRKDGAAKTAWLAWLEERAEANDTTLTEMSVAIKLLEFRKKQDKFFGHSFDTISSSGPNSAIIHYTPTQEKNKNIDFSQIYLVDSGGQYLNGTTDVTRTMHFGTPTAEEKRSFTRVLQGHIALAQAVFPSGTSGSFLDALARAPLWSDLKEYHHGTGHGVGCFLNVHEGPHFISISRKLSQGITNGICLSNEPGYYKKNDYGIRIESVILSKQVPDSNFLEFETITQVPIQTKMVDFSILLEHEARWLNEYHDQVKKQLTPLLAGDSRAIGFLERSCAHIDYELEVLKVRSNLSA